MSREVRRVPLDFDAPLNKVWQGYITPDRLKPLPCTDCENGWTAACEWLRILCSRIQGLASDIGDQRAGKPAHPYLAQDMNPFTTRGKFDGRGWTELPALIRPSDDILPLVAGLTGRDEEHLMHPVAGDHSLGILLKIVAAAGLDPDTWGICTTCGGEATLEAYPGQRAEAEAWEWTQPPEGEGWQLWETVSEGSPISPPYATAEELARWMSSPAYSWGAIKTDADRPTYETALRFVMGGWAPTLAETPAGDVVSGVEWAGHSSKEG